MKLRLLGLSGIVSVLALGCGTSGGVDGVYGEGGYSDEGGEVVSPNGDDGGLLTAGDWDDNLNFGLFRDYWAEHGSSGGYAVNYDTGDRVTIRVTTASGQAVSNALVSVLSGGAVVFAAPTGADGRVLFFPGHDGAGQGALSVEVEAPPGQTGVEGVAQAAPAGSDWQIALPGAEHAALKAIDLAFVLDTTGSMGDELSYLQDEIEGIVSDVHAKFADTSVRLGLIVYRDHGDDYVVDHYDFTDSVDQFKAALDAQSADGGGDTPEAMDEALVWVPALDWRTGDVARMAVLVADAPPHEDRAQATVNTFDGLRTHGIKLYPLAASGVDVEAERLMRLGAQATGGRYMFLTNDSGVGGDHQEPVIPCYQVRKLRDVVSYEIASELSGVRAPVPEPLVIRSVGDPTGGVCELESGEQAHLW